MLDFYELYCITVAPMIWIPNQLIGTAIGKDVTLECITEAMPKAIAYWVFNGTMIMTAGRFRTHEHHHSSYKLDLKLHIHNVQKEDYGQYKCLSKNSHGDNEGSIMLYGKNTFFSEAASTLKPELCKEILEMCSVKPELYLKKRTC